MTCLSGSIENIVFVRWIAPELKDLVRLSSDVVRVHTLQRKPIAFIAIAPAQMEPPAEDLRRQFTHYMDIVGERCGIFVLVVEGQGIKMSVMRTLASAMLLGTRYRSRAKIVEGMPEALKLAEPHYSGSTVRIIEKARSNGWLS